MVVVVHFQANTYSVQQNRTLMNIIYNEISFKLSKVNNHFSQFKSDVHICSKMALSSQKIYAE